MLFSISESGWWVIAVGATVFFMGTMASLPVGLKVPDEMRSTLDQLIRRSRLVGYLVTPLFAAVVLGTNLLRPDPAPQILFLYSVMFVSVPLSLYPVRGRMFRDYVAQQRNPDAEIKPDRLSTAWIIGFLSVVLLVAVFALMATPYGMRS